MATYLDIDFGGDVISNSAFQQVHRMISMPVPMKINMVQYFNDHNQTILIAKIAHHIMRLYDDVSAHYAGNSTLANEYYDILEDMSTSNGYDSYSINSEESFIKHTLPCLEYHFQNYSKHLLFLSKRLDIDYEFVMKEIRKVKANSYFVIVP